MKYKVGDKVRIVSKGIGRDWNSYNLMDKYLDTIMTISNVHADYYDMEEDVKDNLGHGWAWYEHMIEGLAE